ncbi:winged helix-turn-helix domain-containing protein [Serratia fonticola]
MEKTIFGYYIGNDVHFDITNKTLINVNKDLSSRQKTQVMLRDTMLRLLVFLLDNANGTVINNTDILINVWEAYGLSSSNQRLWQVMQGLRKKLSLVGISDDFIMRVESKGYYVRENMITVLYSEKKITPKLEHQHDIRHH